jgi:hypothetical protein
VLSSLEIVRLCDLHQPQPFESYAQKLLNHSEKLAQLASVSLTHLVSTLPVFEKPKVNYELTKNAFDIPVDKLSQNLAMVKTKIEEMNQNNPNRMLHLSESELELLHTVPIGEMGNYQEAMAKHERFRDPFEDEQDRIEREKSLFGNPYRKLPKRSRTDARSESQDSILEVLNEEEEEASHEFQVETKLLNQTSLKRKTFGNSRNKIPPLSKKCAVHVPLFSGLKWEHLKSIDHEMIIDNLIESQIETIASELEVVTDHELEEKEPILMTGSETDSEIVELSGMMDSKIDDGDISNDWKSLRQEYYEMITMWPRGNFLLIDYDEKSVCEFISKYFLGKDQAGKLGWARDLAKEFKQRGILDFIDSIKM